MPLSSLSFSAPLGSAPLGRGPARRLRPLLATLALFAATPAFAQQNQQWFVPPGQDGGRTAQGQRPAQQRPPQQAQQAQRPATPPPGQQPPAAVIGIVDVPEVQRASTAMNQVREEIEKRRQKLNDDLQREQTAWRDAQQQLANQRATLQPEQLRQRERDLQDRITESQRIFRERSRGIEQAAQQGLMQIEQALVQVIRGVSASRNVNFVVQRPLVILSDPGFDLTEEVTQQLNRQLRAVNIPAEGAPVAGGDAPAGQQPAAQAAGQAPGQASGAAQQQHQPQRPAQRR